MKLLIYEGTGKDWHQFFIEYFHELYFQSATENNFAFQNQTAAYQFESSCWP